MDHLNPIGKLIMKVHSFLFSTFDISADTRLIEDLKKKKYSHAIVVKRSWIYGIFISWLLLVTLALTALNMYNAYEILGTSVGGITILSFLSISVLLLIKSSIVYLYRMTKTYDRKNEPVPIDELIENLTAGDKHFISFFTQITFNIVMFSILILVNGVHIIQIALAGNGFSMIAYGIFDIFCLAGQIYAIHFFRKKMIDLEMDFNVVVPGAIYLANQSGMYGSMQLVEATKIKTIKADTASFIASFFNLGTVTILMEGDAANVGTIYMFFTDDPKDTTKHIQMLLKEPFEVVKNPFLKKILKFLSISESSLDEPENVKKVQQFLKENDDAIKAEYKSSDFLSRKFIEETYQTISDLVKV